MTNLRIHLVMLVVRALKISQPADGGNASYL
jgi:hypothetical protein